MRVRHSFMILLVAATTAAGCAQQPVARVQGSAALPPSDIDNVVYGQATTPMSGTPAPVPMAPKSAPVVMAAAPGPAAPGPLLMTARGPRGAAVAMPFAYAPETAEGPYTLDSGDRLRIVVFGQDGLTNSYFVDASGHIAMPLIGSVSAHGTTTHELSNRSAEKLRQAFLREPHVAVEIEAYRPFFILGEVTQPGQYPYVANMTAETAIAIAGGFTPRAFRRDLVVSRTADGVATRMTVPLNFPLRPGDTVNVQERWF